jgi:hypothetical protein
MADAACRELGIPARLHASGRAPEPTFAENETLFHRLAPTSDCTGGKVPASVFEVSRLPGKSFDRSLFCACPEDVLYSTKSRDHFINWGIIGIPLARLRTIVCRLIDQDVERRFSLRMEHAPERCKYPHSELLVLESDVPQGSLGSRQVKSILRSELALASHLIKEPGQLSDLEPA